MIPAQGGFVSEIWSTNNGPRTEVERQTHRVQRDEQRFRFVDLIRSTHHSGHTFDDKLVLHYRR